MSNIESNIVECPNGETFNIGRWWTEPIETKGSPDEFIFCGGNIPSGGASGKGTNDCIFVDVNKCEAKQLPTAMSTSRQALQPICTKGQCYLFGGNTVAANDETKSVDLLEMGNKNIGRQILELPEPRLCYAAIKTDDSHILISGGYGVKDPSTGKGPVYDTAVLLDTLSKEALTLKLIHKRGGHSITKLSNRKYLIIGGAGDDPKGAEIFDAKTNVFKEFHAKMQYGRKDHRAVLVRDGKVYIVGGTMGSDAPTSIEVFDPKKETFSDTGLSLSEGREDVAVKYIKELDIIIAVGGEKKSQKGEPESSAIDVIDFKNNKVVSGSLKTPRDEAEIVVKHVDAKKRIVKVLVLTGQRKIDGKEMPLPVEEITIKL